MGGEFAQDIHNPGILPERGHRIAHHAHAQHQDTEAQEHCPQIFQCPFLAHDLHDKSDGNDQGDVIGQVEGNQLGGHGGPDVGPHNNPKSLFQVHKPGVHQTHGHHRGGTGRLEHCRNPCPQSHPIDGLFRQLPQDFLEPGSCRLLQAIAHHLHAVQEKRNAA